MTASPSPAQPVTAADLIARIKATRAELEAFIGRLSEAELTRPGPEGWSVKDHLAHLAAWQRAVLARYQGRPPWDVLGLDVAVYQTGDDDIINAALQQQSQSQTLPAVLDDLRRTQAQMLAAIEALGDAGLQQPFQPESQLRSRTWLDAISGNTYQHDAEHQPWMEQVVAAGPRAESR
jgi:uncharacterized damage-inducible protein DinB